MKLNPPGLTLSLGKSACARCQFWEKPSHAAFRGECRMYKMLTNANQVCQNFNPNKHDDA